MKQENQTEFHSWLSSLPKFLEDYDASIKKAAENVTVVTQESNGPSIHKPNILGNKQSKTYPVDRLDEILEKQRVRR